MVIGCDKDTDNFGVTPKHIVKDKKSGRTPGFGEKLQDLRCLKSVSDSKIGTGQHVSLQGDNTILLLEGRASVDEVVMCGRVLASHPCSEPHREMAVSTKRPINGKAVHRFCLLHVWQLWVFWPGTLDLWKTAEATRGQQSLCHKQKSSHRNGAWDSRGWGLPVWEDSSSRCWKWHDKNGIDDQLTITPSKRAVYSFSEEK